MVVKSKFNFFLKLVYFLLLLANNLLCKHDLNEGVKFSWSVASWSWSMISLALPIFLETSKSASSASSSSSIFVM